MPYEGYVRNRFKHMPTDSYLYLARQLEKCMMSNYHGSVTPQQNFRGLVTTQKIKI